MNLVGEWIAISQEQIIGRGQLVDEQFSIVEQENSICLSQRELMRHRLRIFSSGRIENWRGGTLWRSGHLIWDVEQGVFSPDGDQEEWMVEDDGNWEMDELNILESGLLERIRFEVSIGSYFHQETTLYTRAQTLHPGMDETAFLLRAIGDLDIADKPFTQLQLSHWTIAPAEVAILLERPELRPVTTLDLADVRCGSHSELIDVLLSGWHAPGVSNWNLNGLCGIGRFLAEFPSNSITSLSIARSDVEDAELLQRFTDIECLNIDDCILSNLDLNTFPRLRELHAQGLGELDLSPQQANELELLSCDMVANQPFPKLHTLSIVKSVSLELLQDCPHLISLSLACDSIDDVVWTRILKLPLQALHCLGLRLTPSQQEALIQSSLAQRLHSFSLTQQPVAEDFIEAITQGDSFRQLRSLNLNQTGCSLRKLCQSSSLVNLLELNADGCNDWEASLYANGLVSLRKLSIRHTGIQIQPWLDTQSFASLEIADLGGNTVTESVLSNPTKLKQIRLDPVESEQEKLIKASLAHVGDNRNRIFHHLPIQPIRDIE